MLQYNNNAEELTVEMIKALGKAYRHPWHKLEGQIKYRQERQNFAKIMKDPAHKKVEKEEYEHASEGDIFSDRGAEARPQNLNIDKMIKVKIATNRSRTSGMEDINRRSSIIN